MGGPSVVVNFPLQEQSPEFVQGWNAALRHLQALGQGELRWVRSTLEQPMLEHLAFLFGNQLFFVMVQIEGVTDESEIDSVKKDRLKDISRLANAWCCALPLQRRGNEFAPLSPGWGLLELDTDRPIDPPRLVTKVPILMSDYEVHGLATQSVKTYFERQGMQSIQRQPYMEVDPSIWFVGPRGLEFVIVRAVRYPILDAAPPKNVDDIRAFCAPRSKIGNFASVSLAREDDPFYPDHSHAKPILRGYTLLPRFNIVPL